MESSFVLLVLTAPVALLAVTAVAAWNGGAASRGLFVGTRIASALGLIVAAAGLGALAWQGPLVSPTLGFDEFGLSLRLDALSLSMFTLVAGLGAAVLRFSRRYLDGDPRHGTFLGGLAATIASVMLLVLSGNLVQLVLAWTLTSYALQRLLLFRSERPAARVAARKKWIVARLGDACLVLAAVLIARAFGTGDIGLLLERASLDTAVVSPGVHAGVALVVLSAALKSAQFPTHGWLAEVMETPTPVSALLHAGILNGGTFLIVRLGEVVILSEPTMVAMIAIGAVTSVFASVVMITQTSVKVTLAYSSAAHMGFMLFLCGLGAFPVAILHLIAHSFYKAHAFLASGSAIETRKGLEVPGAKATPSLGRIGLAFGAALVGVGIVGVLFGVPPWKSPVVMGLSAVLAIGLTQLLARADAERTTAGVVVRGALAGVATTVAFFGLETAAAAFLAGSVPASVPADAGTIAAMALVVLLYAAVVVVQLRLPELMRSPRVAALWVHVRNGFYVNASFDRLVGAHVARDTEISR